MPTDLYLHDTWYVVAHFHFTVVGGAVFAFFAGVYYWYPKITGRMPSEALAKAHFWLFFLGFNAAFIPMFWLGGQGMRRRVADYPPEWAGVQTWVSCMGLVMAAGILCFLWNLVRSAKKGAPAGDNPWNARTLEWQTSSPPPHENFATPPVVAEAPYGYGVMTL